jgi:hypothetical protein
MNEASVGAEMKGKAHYERSVGEQGNEENGIRDDSQGGQSVDPMLVIVSSYQRLINKGWRGRNERFWRWGFDMNRRRRSNRKRRTRFWRRRR